MEDIKQVIAKNIVDLRRRDGLTQLDLAEHLNYTDKAVSKWERGESVPDIAVLKQIADLFHVTVDYLVTEEHDSVSGTKQSHSRKKQNRAFITGMSVLLVWLIATVAFVVLDLIPAIEDKYWLAFVYAIPVSMVVWLVFNSIWFNRRRNFLIVSLLMWSSLLTLYLTFLPFGFNFWLIFAVGIPGQLIIVLWSRIKPKS